MKTLEKQPIYEIAKKNTFAGLLIMLKHYTLDPTFENFGNFYSKIELRNFHPDHITNEIKNKVKQKYIHFSGNFLHVSWAFSFDTKDPKQIKELIDTINTNKKRKEYKESFLNHFNAIRFKITHTLNSEENKKLRGFNGDWWIENKYDNILNIDQIDQVSTILKQLRKNHKKELIHLEDKEGKIEVEFFERHYLPEEWDELRKMFNKEKLPAYQFSRVRTIKKEDEKKFKVHTFKATGRKILFYFTPYYLIYKEVK